MDCTPEPPGLSVAARVTVTEVLFHPLAFGGGEGVANDVGGVVSLATVTLMIAAVAVFPAASRATAVMVCAALATVVVFQEMEYGPAKASAPRLAPSSLNWTPTTPT